MIESPAALAVRRLAARDRAAILAHLLALNPDDRYGRFASALSDQAIASYVVRIALDRDLAFGIGENSGRLSAFIHLAVHDEIGELGASVLPECRRQGQARRLFAIALAQASHLGIARVHLATGHPAALRICHGLGHTVEIRPTAPRACILLDQRLSVVG